MGEGGATGVNRGVSRLEATAAWGCFAIAAATGTLLAVVQDKRILPPAIALGVAALLAQTLWRWEAGPYSAEITRFLSNRSLSVYMFYLIGVLSLQALIAYGFLGWYVRVGRHPCACPGIRQGREWLDVVSAAGVISFGEFVVFYVLILSVYRLAVYRPPHRGDAADGP